MAVVAGAREVPIEIIKKRRAWKTWAIVWNVANTLMGVVAASLSTLVAANAKGNFLEARGVIICSMTTAALAFLGQAEVREIEILNQFDSKKSGSRRRLRALLPSIQTLAIGAGRFLSAIPPLVLCTV